ncbi:MAG: hypothetical protein HRU50_01340 [Winogradskyella sp.]|uniref:DUF6503 family protein n=1 Tax=Winogradskyella sp. TaxID=1883156 RepID=UPI0025CDA9C4|nr:DUF6503 family protein [Winogradskyella sp.]NRB58567.1 hypothetical protein [Winogradskyella sp.]
MKKIVLILSVLMVTACKNQQEVESTIMNKNLSKEDVTTSIYPEDVTKVFNAHGGIDKWNTMKTLSFTMEKANGKEVTTTNLKTRSERIETPTYTLGYDGKNIWVSAKDGNEYKGNARFYKGLMMYFYAMPFIIGDDGITYETAEPLTFEDRTYPGILISYEAGIGESPDDQYIIYYDEATGQMEWLAYTVTFGKNEKSKDFHFIRYNNWQDIKGLKLPKSIDWYSYENNQPIAKNGTTDFLEVKLLEEAPNKEIFMMEEGDMLIK